MITTADARERDELVAAVERTLGPLSPAFTVALRETPVEVFARADAVVQEQDAKGLLAREGRTPLAPSVIARLVHALQPSPLHRALVYGSGTGYVPALLSRLVRQVFSIEWLASLAPMAERTLGALGVTNVRLQTGHADVFRDRGPFDLILIPFPVPEIPASLKEQLAVGGRLVAPVRSRRKRPTVVRLTQISEGRFEEESLGELRFGKRLGDLVVETGAADRKLVERAAAEANSRTEFLGEVLQRVAQVSETDIARALAVQRGMRFGTVDELTPLIDLEVVRSVSRKFLEHHRVVPIRRHGTTLEVATCDSEIGMAQLAELFHPNTLEFWLVTPTDYRRLWGTIDLMLSGGTPVSVAAPATSPSSPDLGVRDEHHLEARFVALFESILLDAIGERASDIHLERYGDQVRLRIRVDGDLRDVPRYRLSPADMTGIVNVIKIRANLDIAEHRLPQGGRFRVTARGKVFDLRIQVQPALHAEHAVIRLLPQDVKILTVEDLGFDAELAAQYRELIDQPAGLVLVVGPTGSGKTTTLYAGLQILAGDPSRKVITVEDPIEYAIDRIQQTAVRPEIGFSFADAMRSFVRQDPDVILVGEIRDHETALEAIRASQTGHLVFSTLHCNDSTDAVQRLIDLGMHPNSIASELLAVLSQRLARRICEGCKRETKPDPQLAAAVFPDGIPDDFRCWQGAGCGRCSGHGTYGRIACVEFLRADAALRNTISLHPPAGELRRLALQARLTPLRESALRLVREGKIAFGDLRYLLSSERLAPELRNARS